MRWLLRSKIYKATVMETNLDYIENIAIGEELIEKAGFGPEKKF